MKSLGCHLGRILRFLQDKTGVSAVEYALIVVAVVAIVGGGVAVLTDNFQAIFTAAETELGEAKKAVEDINITGD